MAALVDDLLELSRLESGDRAPRVGGDAAVRGAPRTSWPRFAGPRDAEGHLADAATTGGARRWSTDPERLRRILENLVDNAVKYTPERRARRRSRRAPAPEARRGSRSPTTAPASPPEHLPRIFERFYRVDKARSRELGGTGLGLSIVKHLAEGMGASVSVESEPGKGSRFTVVLPEPPSRESQAPLSRESQPSAFPGDLTGPLERPSGRPSSGPSRSLAMPARLGHRGVRASQGATQPPRSRSR